MSGVALVQFSSLDLHKLLPITRQGLERSISEPADSIDSNPPLHHMLCVGAIKDPHIKASASATLPYIDLFHAGFIIGALEYNMAEVLEIAGMPTIMVDSVERGISVAFVAGTLIQWKQAILRGCSSTASREVRHIFNLIYGEFNKLGLAPIFEANKIERKDHTFLLEYHK